MIKNLDRVKQFEGCFYVITDCFGGFPCVGNSIEDVIRNFRNNEIMFNASNTDFFYHQIKIFNPKARDRIDLDKLVGVSYIDFKDIVAEDISCRTLITTPNFTRICMEYFDIYNEDKSGSCEACFDYDILYGGLPRIRKNKLYKTDMVLYDTADYTDNMFNFDIVRINNRKDPYNSINEVYLGWEDINICITADSLMGGENLYENPGMLLPVCSLSELTHNDIFHNENIIFDEEDEW